MSLDIEARQRTRVTGHGGGSRRRCLCLLMRALRTSLPALWAFTALEILSAHSPNPRSFLFLCWLVPAVGIHLMVMERHKRKRDDEDGMLVTFYAPDRAFSRVFKGVFSHSSP